MTVATWTLQRIQNLYAFAAAVRTDGVLTRELHWAPDYFTAEQQILHVSLSNIEVCMNWGLGSSLGGGDHGYVQSEPQESPHWACLSL